MRKVFFFFFFELNPSKVLTESKQGPSIIDKIVEVGLLGLSLDFTWTHQTVFRLLGVHS